MQSTLANLIRAVGACELEIEKTRHALTNLTGKHPEKAFNLIDNNGSGYITVSEIAKFLRSYGVHVVDDDVKIIVRYYDVSGTKRISTEDFIKAITPREPNTASKKKEDREIDMALVRFFSKELDLLHETRRDREEIVDSIDGSFDTFKYIDHREKGSFTHSDLDSFLQKNNVLLSKPDVLAAFHRMDRDNDRKVTYKNFQEHLLFEDSSKRKKISRPASFAPFEPASKIPQEKPKTAKQYKPVEIPVHDHHDHDHYDHHHIPMTTSSAYFPSHSNTLHSPTHSQTLSPTIRPYVPHKHTSAIHVTDYTPSFSRSAGLKRYESDYIPHYRSKVTLPGYSSYISSPYTESSYANTNNYFNPKVSTYVARNANYDVDLHGSTYIQPPTFKSYVPHNSTNKPSFTVEAPFYNGSSLRSSHYRSYY